MTSIAPKKCSKKCATNGRSAAVVCNGCQHYFCASCIVQHREQQAAQITNVGREYDSLRQELEQKYNVHAVLTYVNEWEQGSIQKIQASAAAARVHGEEWTERKRSQTKPMVDRIGEELVLCRKSNQYPEKDLERWIERLADLREAMENWSTMGIVNETEATSIIHLIKARESRSERQSLAIPGHERFGQAVGAASLSEDGLRAAYLDHIGSHGSTCGVTLYSSGVHSIRFQIVGDWGHYFFSGILTSLQEITARAFETPSAYGWWDFESRVVHGEVGRLGKGDFIEKDDELILTIDCDRRQIQLSHHRTNTDDHLSIDLQVCPFPWKFLVGFDWRGGCVQLLH